MLEIAGTAQPVSRDRHGNWSWQHPEHHGVAEGLRTVPITLTEAVPAASCFPLVFVPGAHGPALHALLRRSPSGRSAFIGGDGRWQAAWLPPRLAAWPFDLVEVGGGHALALHETRDLVFQGPGGTPIFADGDGAALSPETARIAAVLKAHAEGLPATCRAATALRDHGLLIPLDGEDRLLAVNPAKAVALADDTVLALHRAGALAVLHAGLVSRAHLPWMAKAETHLAAASCARPPPLSARTRAGPGSNFLAALAADTSEHAVLLPFPGHSPS
jgi:hypothetical protein